MSCVQNIGLILCNFDVAAYAAVWIAISYCFDTDVLRSVAAYAAVWIAIKITIEVSTYAICCGLRGCMDCNFAGRCQSNYIENVSVYTAVWITMDD